MAADWIKMRVDLQSHPKVVRILSATKSDKFRVIGGLHAVWSVFDTHTTNGILPGYSLETMDHIIGWSGFCAAVSSVGWLKENPDGSLEMPEFVEHNGQSAKRRAEDQKRKRNERGEINSPHSVRKLSATEQDKDRNKSGLEKRREEKNKELFSKFDFSTWPSVPSEQVWLDFLTLRKSKRAPVTQTVINSLGKELTKAFATGLTTDECLSVMLEAGWQSYKFDWHLNRTSLDSRSAANGPTYSGPSI